MASHVTLGQFLRSKMSQVRGTGVSIRHRHVFENEKYLKSLFGRPITQERSTHLL